MPGHEDDLLADHLVGDGGRAGPVAIVVAGLEDELLAEDAAGGVDIGHRLGGPVLHLLAEDREGPVHRPGRADGDVGERRDRGRRQRDSEKNSGPHDLLLRRCLGRRYGRIRQKKRPAPKGAPR